MLLTIQEVQMKYKIRQVFIRKAIRQGQLKPRIGSIRTLHLLDSGEVEQWIEKSKPERIKRRAG